MTSDFQDERVQRIADVTFNDEMGGGAVADWWDLLASIDADLRCAAVARHTPTGRIKDMSDGEALTERGTHRAVSTDSSTERAVIGMDADAPRSVSAATLTATIRERLHELARLALGYNESNAYLYAKLQVEEALAALAVLEQQHADAERLKRLNTELTRDYNAMLIEQSKQRNRAEAAEAALQAIADFEFDDSRAPGWHYRRLRQIARAALAAASAAAEGDDDATR